MSEQNPSLETQTELGSAREEELLKRIRAGRVEGCAPKDQEKAEEAREILLASLYPMVLSIAKANVGKGIPLADLVTAGSYGLVKSLEGFDFREGVRFSSFAYQGIQNEITAFLRKEASATNKSVFRNAVFRRVQSARKSPKERTGGETAAAEISEWLGDLATEQVSLILSRSYGVGSLDETLSKGGETLENRLPSPSISPADAAISSEQRVLLLRAMENLPERERQVLTLLYGLDGGKQRTLKEVGLAFSISGERVRQIKETALFRLRKIMGGKADETIVR